MSLVLIFLNLNLKSYESDSVYEYEEVKLPQESGCFGPNEPLNNNVLFGEPDSVVKPFIDTQFTPDYSASSTYSNE